MTPEILWYPIAGVAFNQENFLPRKIDFSRFRLEVVTRDSLLAISSGELIFTDSTQRFLNKNDLDGIALAIGNFEKRSLVIDKTEYNLFLIPGHDYFSTFLESIKDTIPFIIKEEKENCI